MQVDSLINVIKATLKTLQEQNINITPNQYAKEFNRQAATSRNSIPELVELDQIVTDAIKSHNIKKMKTYTYYELSQELLKHTKANEIINLSYFVKSLEGMISPSYDDKINFKIDKLINKIKENPISIFELRNIEKLNSISKERIELDRKVIKDKTSDVIKLIKLMAKYFDKSLIKSGNSLGEINKIENELEGLELSLISKRELYILQNKLIDTVYELKQDIKFNQEELVESKSKFLVMQEHIENLQESLSKVKKEGKIDFLTGVLNRRAYDIEMEKLEKRYRLFNNKYAIIFMDIDNFKSINDTYSHECGDAILKIFASLLCALTREGDIVVRYGGEEFVSTILYTDVEEVKKYAYRIKKIIEENNFIYENLKLKITFSAGVTFRDKYDSHYTAANKADDLMYKAKKAGRKKIIFDDNFEI